MEAEDQKNVGLRAVALAHFGWRALHGDYMPISKLMWQVSDDFLADMMDEYEVNSKKGELEPLEDKAMTSQEAMEIFDDWFIWMIEYVHENQGKGEDPFDFDDLVALHQAFLFIRGEM